MQVIGDYELYLDNKHFLGAGSFSKVYLGKYKKESNNENKFVAIKIIEINCLTPYTKKIITDEMEIMEIIKCNPHPNIVECYDIIQTNTHVYIIMEYCDSGSLRDIMKKPIKEKYVQYYFFQLANGLKYLDKHSIIHRDIKPRNILLTNNRTILKIADFGFAKKKFSEHSLYDTICGSPLYMAPEIIRNDHYNNQTDLWSIGMILYEMLYGVHPFHKCKTMSELQDILKNVELEIPPKNCNNNRDVSEECLSFLKKLLQKDVSNRMTWDEFFNHPWINKYQYISTKINNNYEKQIISTSFGSLGSKIDEILIQNNTSKKNIDIITDYYDNHIYKISENMKNKYEEFNKKEENVNYNEYIFELELDEYNNKEFIIKDIIENSSVLDNKKDKKSNQYIIIQ